ncbi:hypothetical protein BC628DRAFT_333186 [Trametes gibbosa]|nr:hypothetical protein BC628DRAFT_333186 [Trametes gibbosa]
MHAPSPLSRSSPTPPSTANSPDLHLDQRRLSKLSYESSPSQFTSTAHLLTDRSLSGFPSLSHRFTTFSSSPSISASDSPYLGPSRPLSLGDEVRSSPVPVSRPASPEPHTVHVLPRSTKVGSGPLPRLQGGRRRPPHARACRLPEGQGQMDRARRPCVLMARYHQPRRPPPPHCRHPHSIVRIPLSSFFHPRFRVYLATGCCASNPSYACAEARHSDGPRSQYSLYPPLFPGRRAQTAPSCGHSRHLYAVEIEQGHQAGRT